VLLGKRTVSTAVKHRRKPNLIGGKIRNKQTALHHAGTFVNQPLNGCPFKEAIRVTISLLPLSVVVGIR
jgi:hypothetical protein